MPLPKINKYVGMLLMAGVLAILSVILIVKYLHKTTSEYQAELQNKLSQGMVQVVVPSMDLEPGAVASGINMSQRLFPQSLLNPTAVTADQWPRFEGRVLHRAVTAGKPLLSTDFTKEAVSDFASLLRPGMRAVTITVDEVNSIAGMLRPGDHIDIMLTLSSSGSDTQKVLPLLHRALVLATGTDLGLEQKLSPGEVLSDTFRTVTLELTPTQSSELMLASQLGSFRVALTPSKSPQIGAPTMPMQTGKTLLAKLSGADFGGMRGVDPIQFIIGSGGGVTRQVRYSGMVPVTKPASASHQPLTQEQRQQRAIDALKKLLQNNPPSTTADSVDDVGIHH